MTQSDNWKNFAKAGDSWLIAYTTIPLTLNTLGPKIFTIGHAVELYLKASYLKLKPDNEKYIIENIGHDIKKLLGRLKVLDPLFLPEYEIRDSIWGRHESFRSEAFCNKLSSDDRNHLAQHDELYTVAKLLKNLKYLGTKWRNGDELTYVLIIWDNNNYWIQFFKALRKYLRYPQSTEEDLLLRSINESELPKESASYLMQLYCE